MYILVCGRLLKKQINQAWGRGGGVTKSEGFSARTKSIIACIGYVEEIGKGKYFLTYLHCRKKLAKC